MFDPNDGPTEDEVEAMRLDEEARERRERGEFERVERGGGSIAFYDFERLAGAMERRAMNKGKR